MAALRDPRSEAAARLGRGLDVRVLEPSPPAVSLPPFMADDPLDGGEVIPVVRPGTRTWEELCKEADDTALRAWCADRWLVPRPPPAVPASFAGTREALHAVAEHLLAPVRFAATGKIGLRFTYHGFGTPFFAVGDGGVVDRQVRIEDGVLIDGDRRHELSTLGAAAEFLGIEPGAPAGVFTPSTPLDADAPLRVDPVAARALGDWYGYCALALEQVRAEVAPSDNPTRVQLWPEHFDLAVDLGPDGARANYGGSPGDAGHPEPYLYVGPWEPRRGDFWNEPFGASVPLAALGDVADALAFFRRARQALAG